MRNNKNQKLRSKESTYIDRYKYPKCISCQHGRMEPKVLVVYRGSVEAVHNSALRAELYADNNHLHPCQLKYVDKCNRCNREEEKRVTTYGENL